MEQPSKPAPAKNGFVYRPKWGLIIQCTDEAQQQHLYQQLKAQGLKLKVVVL